MGLKTIERMQPPRAGKRAPRAARSALTFGTLVVLLALLGVWILS